MPPKPTKRRRHSHVYHSTHAFALEDNGNGLIYGQCSGEEDEAPFVADVCRNSSEYTDQEQANARLIVAAPAQALVLDLVQLGVMTLQEGDAEFDGVMYWFDHTKPDWCVSVIAAIGWETARTAIAQAREATSHHPHAAPVRATRPLRRAFPPGQNPATGEGREGVPVRRLWPEILPAHEHGRSHPRRSDLEHRRQKTREGYCLSTVRTIPPSGISLPRPTG